MECLTQADLRGYDSGTLPRGRTDSVRAHLDECETCRKALGEICASKSGPTLHSNLDGTGQDDSTVVHAATSVPNRPGDETTELNPHGVSNTTRSGSSPAEKIAKHFPRIDGYKLVGVLGQGGMGIVYRAVQTKLGRTVALKVLPAMMGTASPSAVTRFRREATAAARLHHTNIIPIYDFGESSDAWYYAMELITGQPLNMIIERMPTDTVARASAAGLYTLLRDALAPSGLAEPPQADPLQSTDDAAVSMSSTGRGRPYYIQVARWIADAADALEYAHSQGIIHRDIKPSNLILSVDGRIMLADFGLAKQAGEESMTMTGSLLGTLRYISPEQAMAKRMRVDHRTDLYSLGATMYELLTFEPTFTGDDDKEILGAIITREPTAPRKINSLIPPELETICLKTLEKSPDARYPTARALAEDLRRFVQDLPIEAKRPGLARRAVKFTRRNRALVIGIAAALLLSVSIVYGVRETSKRRMEEVRRHVAEVKQLCDAGLMYHASREYSFATREFEKALQLDPNHVETLLSLARTKKEFFNHTENPGKTRLLEEADALCLRARQLQPKNIAALNLHAVILKILGRYDEAIAVCQELLAMDVGADAEAKRHYAAAYANLGMFNALADDIESSEANLRKGAELMGLENGAYSTAAWRNLAAAQHFLSHGGSLESLRAALQATPSDTASWVLKARIRLTEEGRSAAEDALDDAKHADRLAGNRRGDAKRVLAMAYLRTGQFDRAVDEARNAVDLGDPPAVNHLIMAIGEAHRGEVASAEAHLADAFAQWPALKDQRDWYAVAPAGQLWFESGAELFAFKREAQDAVGAARLNASPHLE